MVPSQVLAPPFLKPPTSVLPTALPLCLIYPFQFKSPAPTPTNEKGKDYNMNS